MFRLRLRAPLAALLLASCAAAQGWASPQAPEKVRLQLKWLHQFQFAGFYMAKELGYYREEGLEVELVEGRPGISLTEEVVSGRSEYGVNNADLLIDRVAGEPVVVLGVIFQHSPLVLLSLASSGISSPADLVGRRVMLDPEAEAEALAMLASESIEPRALRFQAHSWNLDDLLAGRTDAVSAYATNEALALSRRGIAWSAIRPRTYGIDFYGDCVFTSERELRGHRKRAAAFLRASLRGWDYALAHVEEAAALILSEYSTRKSREELLAEAAAMRALILPELVPLGFMNPGRWEHIGDTHARLGRIPADYSLEGFLYDPAPKPLDRRALLAILLALLSAASASLVYILALRAFNRRLAAEVAARTASLERLNSRLEAEIAAGLRRERLVSESLAEKEILLKEVHHRVKNNLQLVSSMVSLQLGRSGAEGAAGLLKEIRSRVFAMALVHEQLYERGSLAGIDMDDYFRVLAGEIIRAYAAAEVPIGLSVEAKGLRLSVGEAIPMGLLVGELVTNSMKHAFPGGRRGGVSIRFSREGGKGRLVVGDDGVGFAAAPAKPSGLGRELVAALAAQLRGSVEYLPGPGCRVALDFPLEEAPGGGETPPALLFS